MAPKIYNETCNINWNQPAKSIYNFIRGLSPIPTAWFQLDIKGKSPITLKVFKSKKTGMSCSSSEPGSIKIEKGHLYIASSDEWLELTDIQMAGKKRMSAKDFLNGFHVFN